ncbi:CLUMA_CG004968, isoform A [Clunio marinus]|uniref:CLUMA_CG004968, isoform A n=1 Tax=Clunio marinus TaxID=568069 RepID=A0A1J1HUS1_9DIPT|nr:CLUMA_CG004968, isoform A [Clunio marinus]
MKTAERRQEKSPAHGRNNLKFIKNCPKCSNTQKCPRLLFKQIKICENHPKMFIRQMFCSN